MNDAAVTSGLSSEKPWSTLWWQGTALPLERQTQRAAPGSKQPLVNPSQVRAPLQVPSSALCVCDTHSQGSWFFSAVKQHSQGALDRQLWGRLVKSLHVLLSYECRVSKWLNVSGHQCRYELQLCKVLQNFWLWLFTTQIVRERRFHYILDSVPYSPSKCICRKLLTVKFKSIYESQCPR